MENRTRKKGLTKRLGKKREEVRACLSELTVQDGQFSSEACVTGIDYHGNPISGFFNRSCINQGQLEVDIISVNPAYNWAWVRPIGGYFLERDQGIPVYATDLVYIPKQG